MGKSGVNSESALVYGDLYILKPTISREDSGYIEVRFKGDEKIPKSFGNN